MQLGSYFTELFKQCSENKSKLTLVESICEIYCTPLGYKQLFLFVFVWFKNINTKNNLTPLTFPIYLITTRYVSNVDIMNRGHCILAIPDGCHSIARNTRKKYSHKITLDCGIRDEIRRSLFILK